MRTTQIPAGAFTQQVNDNSSPSDLPPKRLTQIFDDRLHLPFRCLGAASHHVLHHRVPTAAFMRWLVTTSTA